MKKSLLSLSAALLLSVGVSAQKYWTADYPYAAGGYTEWSAVADSFLVTLDTDSAKVFTKLSGLTDFTKANIKSDPNIWSVPWGGRYKITKDGDAISVEFNPAVDEYSVVQLNTYKWVGGPSPVATSTSFKNFKLGGYAVNMQPTADGFDNAVITGKILIPEAYKTAIAKYPNKFILRVSVFDAHGHEWNAGGDPFDTLDVFGSYTNFKVSYNTEDLGNPKANPGDGWGEKFHNRLRPTKGGDTTRVPIDFTQIMGLKFYLCPGEKSAAAITGQFVQIKDIVIGADATTEGVFNPWVRFTPGVGLTDVSISDFAFENGVFTFEGAGKVVDLQGRTILTGEGSISIESLEKGAYALVAEGKSAAFIK